MGYVVLCPDALCFEDRQDPDGRLKGGDFERFEFLRQSSRDAAWHGKHSGYASGHRLSERSTGG